MLYESHMRGGVIFGASIAIASVTLYKEPLLSVPLILAGAVVGARLPDTDTGSSRPSKRYPLLNSINRALGVKHRGPISHGVIFNSVVFLGIWWIVRNYIEIPKESELLFSFSSNVFLLTFAFAQFYRTFYEFVWSIPKNPENFIAYILIENNVGVDRKSYRPNLKPLSNFKVYSTSIVLALIFSFMFKSGTLQETSNYFLGIWGGVMSHILLDAMTTNGHKMGNGRKFNVFGPLSKHIKTGSGIELWFRAIFSIMCIFLLIVLIATFLTKITGV